MHLILNAKVLNCLLFLVRGLETTDQCFHWSLLPKLTFEKYKYAAIKLITNVSLWIIKSVSVVYTYRPTNKNRKKN